MHQHVFLVDNRITDKLHQILDLFLGCSSIEENTGNSSCFWKYTTNNGIDVSVEFQDSNPTQVIVKSEHPDELNLARLRFTSVIEVLNQYFEPSV